MCKEEHFATADFHDVIKKSWEQTLTSFYIFVKKSCDKKE